MFMLVYWSLSSADSLAPTFVLIYSFLVPHAGFVCLSGWAAVGLLILIIVSSYCFNINWMSQHNLQIFCHNKEIGIKMTPEANTCKDDKTDDSVFSF
jgi:hypothetical protein